MTDLEVFELMLVDANEDGRADRFADTLSGEQLYYLDVSPNCFAQSLAPWQWAVLAGKGDALAAHWTTGPWQLAPNLN